jgi:hypothetical protein
MPRSEYERSLEPVTDIKIPVQVRLAEADGIGKWHRRAPDIQLGVRCHGESNGPQRKEKIFHTFFSLKYLMMKVRKKMNSLYQEEPHSHKNKPQ